ncbi:DUF4185 domain-containing protein [Streptomyces sp. NPDC056405]|uniref:DUF4185 domain-containing protein n=1 Tax=Streptomyces sp. NPDC056405 TaxID=3345811 RepID=UPI0035DAF004
MHSTRRIGQGVAITAASAVLAAAATACGPEEPAASDDFTPGPGRSVSAPPPPSSSAPTGESTSKAPGSTRPTASATSGTKAPAEQRGFVYPAPGQRTGAGALPVQAADSSYLGRQDYGREVARDLGFSGVLNGQSLWTYGDTLVPDGKGGYQFTASGSIGLGVQGDPLKIKDKNVNDQGWPQQWIPLTEEENRNGGLGRFAEGGTNVVEYAPNKGLVWYLKNDRGEGGKGILGAGVATVTASAEGVVAHRPHDMMWEPDEPHWGDVGVTYNPGDKKVYVYGYGPEGFGRDVYLARVSAERATDVSAYEYWDQSAKSWTDQRFTKDGRSGTRKLTKEMALFSNNELGQSNAFWSNHYNTWMFVAGANVGYTDVMVMTAPKLEGPWTKPKTVASTCPTGKCSSMRYAIAPHPEYDPSGKTLLVTWTDENIVHSTRIRWK